MQGIVVDTHVQRNAQRLDLTKNTNPVKIEQNLMKIIPREKWFEFPLQLIYHGRALCVARKPKCAECKLDPLCYAKDKTCRAGREGAVATNSASNTNRCDTHR